MGWVAKASQAVAEAGGEASAGAPAFRGWFPTRHILRSLWELIMGVGCVIPYPGEEVMRLWCEYLIRCLKVIGYPSVQR